MLPTRYLTRALLTFAESKCCGSVNFEGKPVPIAPNVSWVISPTLSSSVSVANNESTNSLSSLISGTFFSEHPRKHAAVATRKAKERVKVALRVSIIISSLNIVCKLQIGNRYPCLKEILIHCTLPAQIPQHSLLYLTT